MTPEELLSVLLIDKFELHKRCCRIVTEARLSTGNAETVDALVAELVQQIWLPPRKQECNTSHKQRYLVNMRRSTARAHLWDADKNDTVCRMYSTGGLRKASMTVRSKIDHSRLVCLNCLRATCR